MITTRRKTSWSASCAQRPLCLRQVCALLEQVICEQAWLLRLLVDVYKETSCPCTDSYPTSATPDCQLGAEEWLKVCGYCCTRLSDWAMGADTCQTRKCLPRRSPGREQVFRQ